jgi:hypothetical protein
MNEQDDMRQPDAPQGWTGYHNMLNNHGRVDAPVGLTENVARDWKKARRSRIRRRQWRVAIAVPAVALLVVGLFSVDVGGLFENQAAEVAPHVNVPHQDNIVPEEEAFAAPNVPPVWLDSSLPAIDVSLPEALNDSTMIDIEFHPARPADTPVTGDPLR